MDSDDEAFGELLKDSEGRKPWKPKVRRNIDTVKAPQSLGKKKQQSPQAAMDDFWAAFQSKYPGKGKQQIVTSV
jgi:hypothetical protein